MYGGVCLLSFSWNWHRREIMNIIILTETSRPLRYFLVHPLDAICNCGIADAPFRHPKQERIKTILHMSWLA